MEKEYLTVTEIAKAEKITTRCVRNKIHKLISHNDYNSLIQKDLNGNWQIHRLLKKKFKPKRKKKSKYYALTIDFLKNFKYNDIKEIMNHIFQDLKIADLEINYVVEQKKSNGQNHVHLYTNCSKKRELIKKIRSCFSSVSYKESKIYDLQGWINYITKESKIIKLKK